MNKPAEVFKDELAAPGFLKTGSPPSRTVSSEQRTALVRKGNQLFNAGNVEQAKRVFLTTRYTDGIIRVGDYYMKNNKPLEAFRMYWLAPERRKSEQLIEKMAGVVRTWLEEGNDA